MTASGAWPLASAKCFTYKAEASVTILIYRPRALTIYSFDEYARIYSGVVERVYGRVRVRVEEKRNQDIHVAKPRHLQGTKFAWGFWPCVLCIEFALVAEAMFSLVCACCLQKSH